MNTVILGVRSLDETFETVREVWRTGRRQPAARINFATAELLWQVLTAKRWEILQAMCGQGPLTIRDIARRVYRDVKPVHADVQALLRAGVLDKTEQGRAVFPYDTIHVDFTLKAA